MKDKIKKIFFGFLVLYISVIGGMYFAQRGMIYFPQNNIPDITPYEELGVSQISVNTSDGISLVGWFSKPQRQKESIIFFHGNASSIRHSINKALPYMKAGHGVILASYRGYDRNKGKPSEYGFYKDARAWIQKLNSLSVSTNEMVLYGESKGTGVAVQMATEFPNIRALVLESPYTNLPDVAADTYPIIPVRILMKDRFDSLSKIKKINAPLYIIQGTEDKIIPPKMGQDLFNSANVPKEILKLEGFGHNNMPNDLKYPAVINFIQGLD